MIATILTLAAFAQEPVRNQTQLTNTDGKAHIKFETQTIDFGKIKKDVPAEKNFPFTNTGTAPLIITGAHQSCGCTTPHTPKEAILPGAKNVIGAGFNAHNMGPFTKTITVSTNAEENNIVLTIKGEVIE
ncbi:MAG: hypothetical protein JWO03_884 [Bacteroidetes bacterium]|nr:hypothetical protein [Bacteroidota bacterium]